MFRCPSFKFLVFSISALVLLSSIASAQQNLFNVPSGIITPKGELFFQQQFNVGKTSGH